MNLVEDLKAIVRSAVVEALAEIERPKADVEPLWETSDVAKYLGCTERHVANLRAKGMPWRRAGDVVRYDRAEIDAWTRLQARDE